MKARILLTLALLLTVTNLFLPKSYAQAKPDLIITDAQMTKQMRGDVVYQITVTITVANYCHGTTAGDSLAILDFYTDVSKPPGRSYDYHAPRTISSIAGGESKTMTFKITKDFGTYILGNPHPLFVWINKTGKLPRAIFRVDLTNQVKEASETNNSYQVNPTEAPAKLGGQYQCSPKV